MRVLGGEDGQEPFRLQRGQLHVQRMPAIRLC